MKSLHIVDSNYTILNKSKTMEIIDQWLSEVGGQGRGMNRWTQKT